MTEPTLQPSSLQHTRGQLLIALVGNPNSGKTTVFNALTKMNQKVGNYPGVTVEKKIGRMVSASVSKEVSSHILDLPGTYSLAVRSPDEEVVRSVLLGLMVDTPRPDLVVCVVDATNLERNLYLFSQIQDLGLPIILNLNMMDMAQDQGIKIDIARLSQALRVPVVPTSANQGKGIEELKAAIICGAKPVVTRDWRMPDLV